MFIGNSDKLNSLATILLFIYRSKLADNKYDKDIIVSIVDMIKSKNTDIMAIKDIIKTMIKDEVNINKSTLQDSISLNLPEESIITKKLLKLISVELSEKDMKRYLYDMANIILESSNILKANNAVNSVSYALNTKDLTTEETIDLLKKLKKDLDVIDDVTLDKSDNTSDDMDSVDLSDDSMFKTLDKVNNGDKILLKTGWDEFNKSVGGGLYTGELTVIEALQHKNKTGFTLSLFLQTMLNNKVEIKDGKRPLWMWISLEDDVTQIIIKIFVYLYFRKHKQMPIMLDIDTKFISDFIKKEIDATGNKLIIKRIDNSLFTIERFTKIVEGYELTGNRVVVAAVDYLEKAYTDGSKYSTGPNGSGLKNMFTYFRTYIQKKNILFMTPHQIAVDAIGQLRNGASDREFLKLINGKNFTQGSRGLPQEFDIEILIHLCKINGIDYQAVQIGKFKRPDYVDPRDKFMLIPFEKSGRNETKKILAPLMEDCSASNMIMKDNTDDSDSVLDL